ncbi:MAG: hypothetical protein L6263_00255 [Desulfobacteraceae bacterium]|nr:hypothetical protein [Desulfobacteraceae bacterium]
MLYVNPSPPLYTEACAASSRMKNPSPVLIIRAMNKTSVFFGDAADGVQMWLLLGIDIFF